MVFWKIKVSVDLSLCIKSIFLELAVCFERYKTVTVREYISLTLYIFLLLSLSEQTVVLLPRSPSPSKRYFPIPLDSLEEEFRLRMADDGKLFREEFNVRS